MYQRRQVRKPFSLSDRQAPVKLWFQKSYSVTTVSKIHDFSGGMFCHTQLNEVLKWTSGDFLSPLILQKMKEDISQLGDYDEPFCEQQYTHGPCYISLFRFKSFDQLILPKLPQI